MISGVGPGRIGSEHHVGVEQQREGGNVGGFDLQAVRGDHVAARRRQVFSGFLYPEAVCGDHHDIGQATSVSQKISDVGGCVRQGDRSVWNASILRLFWSQSVSKTIVLQSYSSKQGCFESERRVVSEIPDMLADNEMEAGCGAERCSGVAFGTGKNVHLKPGIDT